MATKKQKVGRYANSKQTPHSGDSIALPSDPNRQGVVEGITTDNKVKVRIGMDFGDYDPGQLNFVARRSPRMHTRIVGGKKITVRPHRDNVLS